MTKIVRCGVGVTVGLLLGFLDAPSLAQGADQWWPVKIYNEDSGKAVEENYSPLPTASKPWNLCVLFPHMKDTFWVAVDYGVVKESERMRVNMTLYEAGGYENLPKQLSQFDDCMASNFDAIIVGAISEAGLTRKIREATSAGKPVIGTVNPCRSPRSRRKCSSTSPILASTASLCAVRISSPDSGASSTSPTPIF